MRQTVPRITLSKAGISSSHAVIGMVERPLCRSSEEALVYFKNQDEGVNFSFHSVCAVRNNKDPEGYGKKGSIRYVGRKKKRNYILLMPVATTPTAYS